MTLGTCYLACYVPLESVTWEDMGYGCKMEKVKNNGEGDLPIFLY